MRKGSLKYCWNPPPRIAGLEGLVSILQAWANGIPSQSIWRLERLLHLLHWTDETPHARHTPWPKPAKQLPITAEQNLFVVL